MEELDATPLLSCLGVADASLWHPILALCLPLSLSKRLKIESNQCQDQIDFCQLCLPLSQLSTQLWAEVGHLEYVVCMCMQNRAVESRLTVLCQDISVHRELNARNIGGPWASLFYPLKQRQNRQELGGGYHRSRFPSYSPSHQPLEAAPTGAILSSHIALINYNPSFSISPP